MTKEEVFHEAELGLIRDLRRSSAAKTKRESTADIAEDLFF